LLFSNIFKIHIHLAFSSLGAMTGTTGHVFLLVLHPISCKSGGCRPTVEGLCVLHILLKTLNRRSNRKNMPYPFTINPITDVQHKWRYRGGMHAWIFHHAKHVLLHESQTLVVYDVACYSCAACCCCLGDYIGTMGFRLRCLTAPLNT
jgi:hypothetical protein